MRKIRPSTPPPPPPPPPLRICRCCDVYAMTMQMCGVCRRWLCRECFGEWAALACDTCRVEARFQKAG